MATNSSLLGIPLHNLCIIRNANSSLSNFIIGVPIMAANESGCIIPETNTFPLDKFGAALVDASLHLRAMPDANRPFGYSWWFIARGHIASPP